MRAHAPDKTIAMPDDFVTLMPPSILFVQSKNKENICP